MIDNSSIEALKNSIDIVDVIGNYIELRKAGANYKANCPFHGEKTASFVVSPSKQIYHCFGCGVGGDAIRFVMELEKLSYPEAIEKIASSFNFTLRYSQGSSDYSNIKRVLESVQKWYVKNLDFQPQALEYLHRRGISKSSIEDFEIGYVGRSGEVMQFLGSHHIPLPQAAEAGIVAIGENSGYYARLVERITFPIYSTSGTLVGFGGRTLGNHPAKYINSPQTKLFNKSRLLYGYHRAKEHIYANKKIIVCEGYLDVIMFHQAGFKEAVATLGTALTADHLPLLRKGEPNVILAYDGDKAGRAAALKAAQMLSIAGFEGGVVLFPGGKDPADLIAEGKGDEVARLLRERKPLIPFVIESISSEYDLNSPRAKEEAFGRIKSYLENHSEIIREAYVSTAATYLKISSTLFGDNVKKEKVADGITRPKDDIAQLSILKTLLEKPELIDDVLDIVESSMFGNYRELFDLIVSGAAEDPRLVGITLDESLQAMSQEELMDMLKSFLIRHYDQQLKLIAADNSIEFRKKSYLIRKIKTDIIPRLKRGESVAYKNLLKEV